MCSESIIINSADSYESALLFCDSSILAQTVEAFGSVISNNLNRVVKLLTSMTIILTVPMLVASIYGMNVDLPFQERQHAFWIVLSIALGVSGHVVYVFWKRDWF